MYKILANILLLTVYCISKVGNNSNQTNDHLQQDPADNSLEISFPVNLIKTKDEDNIVTGWGVGGNDVDPLEYPHMAALGYGDWKNVKWGCGGSLISVKFVLTAAHCIDTSMGQLKFIRFGDIYAADNEELNFQDFNISRAVTHPKYKPPSLYNDIALVELDHPIDQNRTYFAPACLQRERHITDPYWSALGWGETSHRGPIAEYLQMMDLRKAEYNLCKKSYLNAGKRILLTGIDDDSQICAGLAHVDTCQGDSGGPLQVRNVGCEAGYIVIGITSFGKPCGLTNKPGVYTRVSHYIKWIDSIVWPQ